MTRHTLLLAACCYALTSYCQRTDTLVLFYPLNEHQLTNKQQQQLDSFVFNNWDRIVVRGFTDAVDDELYNKDLSARRSKTVEAYLLKRKVQQSLLFAEAFGEAFPAGDNGQEEGRALNRRTEVIGYRFPRIKPKAPAEPLKPVTTALDNGFLITYKPGTLPPDLEAQFSSGAGSLFQTISNTLEMRQNQVYNNTTRGEILSSVTIFCGRFNPCKLDSPVLVRVPIPFNTTCPIEKVRFFNTVAENGKRIWQEQTKSLFPEVIDGRKYIRLWLDNFCECINFDFKVDPDCYPVDSSQVYFVNTKHRNVTIELKGLNSVYMPRKVEEGAYSVVHLKDQKNAALVSFSIYKGKRWIKSYSNQPLSNFSFDSSRAAYFITTDSLKIEFPGLKMSDVVLRVNRDRYRGLPDEKLYSFLYLNRPNEQLTIDFTLEDRKGNYIRYKNQQLSSIPFDAAKGCYIVDKAFIKQLKAKMEAAALSSISSTRHH
jgi:hypothetical protein